MVRLLKRSLILSFCSFLILFLISNLLLFHIPSTKRQQYLSATETVVSAINSIRNVDSSVLPNQSTVILEPSPGLTCQNNGEGLFLLLMVISSPENVQRRDLIRSVFEGEMRGKWEELFWEEIAKTKAANAENEGNLRTNSSSVTRVFQVLFFVGQSAENGMSDEVRNEWERNGDVVVDDLHESYLNLTVKTLRMLKWVLHNCQSAQYLIKMDDDVFLHMGKLIPYLLHQQNHSPSKNLLAGHLYNQVSVDRDPHSKWFTPELIYKPQKFPPFLAGFCYILGMPAAKQIFEESRSVPLFHLEDVYLTGMVASQRLQYELQQPGQIVTMMLWYHRFATFGWALENIIIHEVSPEQFKCWSEATTLKDIGLFRSSLPSFLSCL